jgi:uncharacterized protein YbjT (DUF2867 family)
MKNVILFGATGNLGREIAKELIRQQYALTVVARNKNKAEQLSHLSSNFIIADVTRNETLTDICKGHEIVISALGKSVSPRDKSQASFREVDLLGNLNILEQAVESKIKKFVYVSAFHAERYPSLEYFKVHHDFSEMLKKSGINYSIIKPPAIFSAFTEMIDLARKGYLVNMGKGDKKTNPIYEGDLAKLCVDSIHKVNTTIEAGGKTIYTRAQLNAIIQREVDPNRKVRTLPLPLLKVVLPFIRMVDKNTFDKFSFFAEVMQQDTIASQIGEMQFEDYIKRKVKEEVNSR